MDIPAVYFDQDFVEANLSDGDEFESDSFKMALSQKKTKHLCEGLEECVLLLAYEIKADFNLGGEQVEVSDLSFVASRVDTIPALKIHRFDLTGKVNGIGIRIGGNHVSLDEGTSFN